MAFWGVVLGLLHGKRAAIPSISLGTLTDAPLLAIVTLVPATLLVMTLTRVPAHLLVLSVRSTALVSVGLILGCLAMLFAGAMVTTSWDGAFEVSRNTAGLFGLAVLGRAVMADAGQLLFPMSFVMLCFLFGNMPGASAPSWWAWLLQDGMVLIAAVQAILLAGIGLVLVPKLPQLALRKGQ